MKRKALTKGQRLEVKWDDAYADSRKRSGLKDIGATIASRGILEKNHPRYIILTEHESDVPERTAKFAFPDNKDIFLAIPWGAIRGLRVIK